MTFQRVQRELSAEEIARLRALRAEGKRLKWLAYEFGISHQAVSRYLRDSGAALVEAMQASPSREIEVEPRREPMPVKPRPPLPSWNLGGAGELHRRDIYDDSEER